MKDTHQKANIFSDYLKHIHKTQLIRHVNSTKIDEKKLSMPLSAIRATI